MKKLGFGFMRLLVHEVNQQEVDMTMVNQMVDVFLERGFTYFDTAYMYHDFKSENILRDALVKRYPRERFTVAAKLPTMFLRTEEDQERIFEEQLEKCGLEYFDYYLLHNLNISSYQTVTKLNSFEFITQIILHSIMRRCKKTKRAFQHKRSIMGIIVKSMARHQNVYLVNSVKNIVLSISRLQSV